MDRARFVLGVDLDGVVADFYEAIRPFAAEWVGRPAGELTPDVSYGLKEWGFDEKGYESFHRWVVTQHDFFSTLDPIHRAGPVLRELSNADVHIRVITHRLFIPHFHQLQVEQTVRWLDRHAIPYRDLCFIAEKTAVGADLYIEDSPRNIQALRDAGYDVIAFTNSTNVHLEVDLRADTWDEVRAIVVARQREWRERGQEGRAVSGV